MNKNWAEMKGLWALQYSIHTVSGHREGWNCDDIHKPST